MQKINSKKICEIIGSESRPAEAEIENISTDSRQIAAGDLFIALKGEKFDGHDYAAQVLQNGAALVMVEHFLEEIPAERQIVVRDCLEAYGRIGAYNRSFFKGKVIGLTGSAGKTTTKEELKFILSRFGKVYATSGNFNNFVGVPKTLCDLDMSADYAVIEMGMSAKGEIARLVSYVQPDIALVTNVYPMHIEFFPDLEAIAEAKAEIFSGLKSGGIAVINADTNFAEVLEKRAAEKGAKIVKFGRQNQGDYQFATAAEGEHHFYNAWATLAVVKELGLDVQKAQDEIKNFGALDGRGKQHMLHLPAGGSYTLIDDSYSGQPEAMKLAIKALAAMKNTGRKIAVIGKMAELGETSQAQHREVGQVAAAADIDIVIGICPETKDVLAQLPESMQRFYFENKEGLDEFLLNKLLQNNDIVLIKGARYSSKLYQVAEALIKRG